MISINANIKEQRFTLNLIVGISTKTPVGHAFDGWQILVDGMHAPEARASIISETHSGPTGKVLGN